MYTLTDLQIRTVAALMVVQNILVIYMYGEETTIHTYTAHAIYMVGCTCICTSGLGNCF